MRLNLTAAVVAAGLCLIVVGISLAAESNVYWRVDLNQGTSIIAYGQGATQEAAWQDCYRLRAITRAMTAAETRKGAVSAVTTQAVRWCKNPMQLATVRPDPVAPTCPTAPADRLRECPTGYTGTWTQRADVGPAPDCLITWSPIAFPPDACTVVSQPPPARPLFIDRFEYDVSRSGQIAGQLFAGSGWTGAKANNVNGRGSGYLYTQPDSTLGSRVLVLESRPSEGGSLGPGFEGGQTDYYLQMGMENAPTTTIPANVWFQFKTYATPQSSFARRDKTMYPCRTAYACSTLGGSLAWMVLWGKGGFEPTDGPAANRYIGVVAEHADIRNSPDYPTNKGKLGQNASNAQLVAGRWYDVKLHFDTSGAQGVYQAWIREQGQSAWTQIADWRGGVTPNFSWPIPADQRIGHRVMRLPTTVNGPGDSTTYMDDFTMARSEAELAR